MGLENFIAESDAAALAGVSIRTLMRFAEAGYLQVENDESGRQLFARSEIKDVFGIQTEDEISEQSLAPEPPAEKVIELTLASARQAQPAAEGMARQAEQNASKYFVPRAVALLEQEVSRLRTLQELQEKLLDMRDREIQDLKEQRDWLRSRLENLEEKSKRDQVLLLSEAQTVRQLISINEQRRSPFRATLEWFGLIKPAAGPGLLQGPGPEDLEKV